ncbi:TPM domain-containing protein [Sphingobacteriales bacterium UPWRP_1]|nr:hypothetical protein BVG80_17200 [Sphingobacteriales bacterium TSM_CSM]PSJ74235.1 TPM domain-containing protein [Sphingobacteriales bacterium UPWRP_1]
MRMQFSVTATTPAIIAVWLLLWAQLLFAQVPPRPNPPKLVNDLAHILPDDREAALELKLVAYGDSTSTQIAVVTVESLGGDAPYNFAQEILEQWGVGQKDKDNGIVILVAPAERQTFISTGYGVESTLTDALSKRIIETAMIPNFKQGNYYEGIDQAVNAIFAVLSGQFTPETETGGNADAFVALFIFIIIILFIIIIIYSARKGGTGMGRTYSGRGVNNSGPVVIHWGDNDYGSFSGGFGSFGGFGGGSGGGGGAGGSW